jgi:hypothetical protein
MFQRSLVTVLAAIGAVLVILGGVVGFLLSLAPGSDFGARGNGAFGALVYGVLAVIFGLIILAFSGYTHYRGVESNLTGGLLLVVLGVVTWIVVGGWVLVAAGSFLAVLAGLLLMLEVFLSDNRIRQNRIS